MIAAVIAAVDLIRTNRRLDLHSRSIACVASCPLIPSWLGAKPTHRRGRQGPDRRPAPALLRGEGAGSGLIASTRRRLLGPWPLWPEPRPDRAPRGSAPSEPLPASHASERRVVGYPRDSPTVWKHAALIVDQLVSTSTPRIERRFTDARLRAGVFHRQADNFEVGHSIIDRFRHRAMLVAGATILLRPAAPFSAMP